MKVRFLMFVFWDILNKVCLGLFLGVGVELNLLGEVEKVESLNVCFYLVEFVVIFDYYVDGVF